MSFLAPAFLAGLAALAVPVLVHLTFRSSGQPTPFPSLHFLRRIPFRTRRRRVLRNPWLFALRCGALALLVAAFARPALPGGPAATAGEEAREVVLLLDRSFSMGYQGRWERAVRGLRRATDGLRPGDRVSLIGFAERAEVLVPPTGDPAVVLAALAELEPGHGSTRYETGLRIAGRLLEESELSRREVVLATDFQATGWPDRAPLGLPGGTEVRSVDAADPDPANLPLSDLEVVRRATAGPAAATGTGSGAAASRGSGGADVAIRVSNAGGRAVSEVRVSLELNGRLAGTRAVELEPRTSTTLRFADVALPDGGVRGELRLEAPESADRLAADDALRFYAPPAEGLGVRVVEPGRGRADRSLYVRRALEIGGRPAVALVRVPSVREALAGDPSAGGPRAGTAPARDRPAGWSGRLPPGAPRLLVLNDAGPGDEAAARALAAYVEAGGGLLVSLGARADPAGWPSVSRDLLPGRIGEVVDRVNAGGARLATVEYDHPVFEPFREPRSGDLSAARFLRYRRVEPDTATRVLARFDDGAPALLERAVGQGRVLLWSSSLDRAWSDFPIQPVYLPFVRRLAVHASGWTPTPRYRIVGERLDLDGLLGGWDARHGALPADGSGAEAAGEAGPRAEWIVTSPSGGRSARTRDGDGIVLLDEPGFWEIRPLDAAAGGPTVAVNPDPRESDLARLDPDELLAAVGAAPPVASADSEGSESAGQAPVAGGPRSGTRGVARVEAESGGRREVWWPVLLAAVGLFLAEAALAVRVDRRGPLPALREVVE